jgi:hypothetical protein
MSYRIPSKARAEELCADVTRRLGHDNARYRVARYPDLNLPRDQWDWGVVREWRYEDRPELGWFGGGFVWFPDPRPYPY